MRNQIIAILVGVSANLFAQVSTEPSFPTSDEEVRIIYDALQGTSSLQDASKVYMHAGVILDSPSGTGWQNVVGNWGQDDGIGELTKVTGEANKWEITINPRNYFSVSEGVDIYRLGMVFRNADGTKEGKSDANQDIFVEINNGQFSLNVESPTSNYKFYATTETIDIVAKTSENATIDLIIDDVNVMSLNDVDLLETTHDIVIDGQVHEIKIEASNGAETQQKTFTYSSTPSTVSSPLPEGMLKGINYHEDNTSVTLVLEAPLKQNVYVLGDFNSWQLNADYLMKQDGELFWLTINDLTTGQPYVFQYLIDGDILVADPYTDQVSDPWDDKYIDQTRYPDLVGYPEGQTEYRASVLETGQAPYDWTITDFEAPSNENLVIYELLVRDFDEKSTYQGVIDRLDYLEELGINALELMPVNEFEGNSSWGYNPNFYFAPDKYYGHKNDLKKLIDACHERGIAVIVDIVLNHSFHSSPLVRMYQSSDGKPAADNPWHNVDHNFQNPDAHWGADFDHESLYTQAFVDSVNHYWLSEYKVDGFRFDFTKGFSNDYKSNSSDSWGSLYDADRIRLLKRMTDEIREVNPDTYVIFEHLSDNTEEKELADYGIMLWGNLNHNYTEIAMGWTNGVQLDWGYFGSRGWQDSNLVTYMESHDEERMMYKNLQYGNSSGNYDVKNLNTGLKRAELASMFFYPIPGSKMVWQFGELGYDISIDENGRTGEKPIKWEYLDDPYRKRLYQITSALIDLKKTYAVFQSSEVEFVNNNSLDKQIILKNQPYDSSPTQPEDMNAVIVGNFGVEATTLNVTFPHTGTWFSYFNKGQSIDVIEETTEITLNTGEYRLFTDVELDKPEIDVVTSISEYPNYTELEVYPNPSRDIINIKDPGDWEYAEILNIQGVSVYKSRLINKQVNITKLSVGLYTLKLTNNMGTKKVIRFIKNNF